MRSPRDFINEVAKVVMRYNVVMDHHEIPLLRGYSVDRLNFCEKDAKN